MELRERVARAIAVADGVKLSVWRPDELQRYRDLADTAIAECFALQPMENAPVGKPGFLAFGENEVEWVIDHDPLHPEVVSQNTGNMRWRADFVGWLPLPKMEEK